MNANQPRKGMCRRIAAVVICLVLTLFALVYSLHGATMRLGSDDFTVHSMLASDDFTAHSILASDDFTVHSILASDDFTAHSMLASDDFTAYSSI